MDKRTKDLIAVGAAMAANCQPCLQKTVDIARAGGADEQDILDAVAVGNLIKNGAAAKMDGFASGMFKDYKENLASAESPCGCS